MSFISDAKEKIKKTYHTAKTKYETHKANSEIEERARRNRHVEEMQHRLEIQKERRQERDMQEKLSKMEREDRKYKFEHSLPGKAMKMVAGRNRPTGARRPPKVEKHIPGILKMTESRPESERPRKVKIVYYEKKKKRPQEKELPGIYNSKWRP